MNTSKANRNLIESVWFNNGHIFVKMCNGKEFANPISAYPNLSKGNLHQLKNYTIEGNGKWVHWEELDEDLSAEGFMNQ